MILLQRSLKIENIQIFLKLKKKCATHDDPPSKISKNENSSNICKTKKNVQPTILLQRSGKEIYRNQYWYFKERDGGFDTLWTLKMWHVDNFGTKLNKFQLTLSSVTMSARVKGGGGCMPW